MRNEHKTLMLLQEEAAELIEQLILVRAARTIQLASKSLRFGPHSKNPYEPHSLSNKDALTMELGDFLALIEVLTLETSYPITMEEILLAKERKFKKLETWFPHEP
jgi:NTP pyrophosphatase (non-canonical NTP hydrolase)